ncbi:MAG: glycosyltransferase family 1 protein [Eubacteriales bacterium]|nr:glycosyltransferase family 1 protein [Eubacteriales bacterium]
MVKILHELAYLDGGGVARLLYDYYAHMDRARIRFDFMILDDGGEGILEKPLREMGCRIFRLPSLRKDPARRLRRMKEILLEGGYDAVHSHIADRSCILLSMAKRCGVRHRFAHSHIAREDCGRVKRAVNLVFLRRARSAATQLFACGEDAGLYMWGKRAMERGRVRIMRNAVSIDRFRYDPAARREAARELGLEGRHVVGIVGRLEHQKNHAFLLDVFAKLRDLDRDAVLLVIGGGSLADSLEEKARQTGILPQVRFLGVRSDVDRLLNVLDVFVLPSFYEGLPVVLVEAQANGLPAVASDAITREMAVTDLVRFLPCNTDPARWAQEIARILADGPGTARPRESYAGEIARAGYDIVKESRRMQRFYLSRLDEAEETGKGKR